MKTHLLPVPTGTGFSFLNMTLIIIFRKNSVSLSEIFNIYTIMRLLTLPIMLVVFMSCSRKTCDVQISCVFQFSPGKYVYLEEIKVYDKILLDSCFVDENQTCHFCISTQQPLILRIRTDHKNYLLLVAQPGQHINITADIRNIPASYTVSGSEDSEQLLELHRTTLNNYARLDTLASIWEKRKYEPTKLALRDSLDSIAKIIYDDQRAFMLHFVDKNKNSLAAITALYQSFGQVYIIDELEDIQVYENVASELRKLYPDNEHVIELNARVQKNKLTLAEREAIRKRLEPGNPVPEISLPDMNDEPFSIASLQGHTLLIYFWHSKDPVCRKTNIELLQLHRTYSKYGFYIIWVALDANKEIWKKVVQSERLPGIHLIDQKEWFSPLVKIFQMQKVPHLTLVDKNGMIIKNNISLDEIKQQLYQFFYRFVVAEKEKQIANDTMP